MWIVCEHTSLINQQHFRYLQLNGVLHYLHLLTLSTVDIEL